MFFKCLPVDMIKEINYFTESSGLEALVHAGPIRFESYSALALKELFSRRDEESLKVQRRFLKRWLHFGHCPYTSILWPQTAEEKTRFALGTFPFEDLFLRLRLRAALMDSEGYQNFEANPPALTLVHDNKSYQRLLPVFTDKEAKQLRPVDKEGRLSSKQVRECLADIKHNLNPVNATVYFDDIAPYLEADHLLALFQNNTIFKVRLASDILKKVGLEMISPPVMSDVFYGYLALYDKIQTPQMSHQKDLIACLLCISPLLPEENLLLCLSIVSDIFIDTEIPVSEDLLIHAIKGAKRYPEAITLLKETLFAVIRSEELSLQNFLVRPFFIILLEELAETFDVEELLTIKTRLLNLYKVEENDVLLAQTLAIFVKLDKKNACFVSVWNAEEKQFILELLDVTKEKLGLPTALWILWQYCCSLSSFFSEEKAREYWVLFKPHLAGLGLLQIDDEDFIRIRSYLRGPTCSSFPLFLTFLPREERGAALLEAFNGLPGENFLYLNKFTDEIFQFETPSDPHFEEAYACYENAIKTRSNPHFLFSSESVKAAQIEKILRANFCQFVINNNGVLGSWNKATNFLATLIAAIPALDDYHMGEVLQAINLLLKQIPKVEYFVYYSAYMEHMNNNNYIVSDSVFLALPSLLNVFWMSQNSEQELEEMQKLILHTLTMEAKTPEFVALQRMARLWVLGFGPEFSKSFDDVLEKDLAVERVTASSSMQP